MYEKQVVEVVNVRACMHRGRWSRVGSDYKTRSSNSANYFCKSVIVLLSCVCVVVMCLCCCLVSVLLSCVCDVDS